MKRNQFIPDYKTVILNREPESNWYRKEPELIPFSKVPQDLKLEETQTKGIKTNLLITSRIVNKRRIFFTGLIPSNFINWYSGDYAEYSPKGKRKSLIIFHFSNDFKILTLYFFNHFYKENRKERALFIEETIIHIQKDSQ